ncbi:PREDICTED: TMV resistance [Prunus dulcis]|uniref:PREDICTED: TMV resistance n=1 Tax=Prunus dulcis TaxID=3755 RepID=A0A5E4FJ60_PRUDU|nr:PREDICTED: TMV resistance [Prunus dulcis]
MIVWKMYQNLVRNWEQTSLAITVLNSIQLKILMNVPNLPPGASLTTRTFYEIHLYTPIEAVGHNQLMHRLMVSSPLDDNEGSHRLLIFHLQGSQKVISIKLQSFWREFDNLLMKDNESIQAFFKSF